MAQVSLPPQKTWEQGRAEGWEEPQGRARERKLRVWEAMEEKVGALML